MKKFLAALLLILAVGGATHSVRAQDLGVVGPRTFVVKALDAASCAEHTFIVADRGLHSHMVVYTTTGTINSIELGIDGSFDGVTYVSVTPGNSFTHPIGSVFALIYMPFIRVHLYACSGSGTITAWYSGTWALHPFSAFPVPPVPPAATCDVSQLCEWDDFISGAVGSGTVGKMGWSLNSTNTIAEGSYQLGLGFGNYVYATSSTNDVSQGHPGQLELASGDSVGGCILEIDTTPVFGGTTYMAGDILTIEPTGGFGDGTATVEVDTVDGGGVILTWHLLTCGEDYVGWSFGEGTIYETSGGGDDEALIAVVHSTPARSQVAIYQPSELNGGTIGQEFEPSGTWSRTYLMLPGPTEGDISTGFASYATGLFQAPLSFLSPLIFGADGAYFYVDSTFGNTITAVDVGDSGGPSGTGYAVNDVLDADVTYFSDPFFDPYAVAATMRVSSVDGGGGITGLELLTGGLDGYFVTDATGAPLIGGSGTGGRFIVTDFQANWRFFNDAANNNEDLDTGVNSQIIGPSATGADWTQFQISHVSGEETLTLTISDAHDRTNVAALGTLSSNFVPLGGGFPPYFPLGDFFQSLEFCPVGSGGTQGVVDNWSGTMTSITEP